MEILLGAMFLSAVLCVAPRVIADAIATVRAASAGRWDLIEADRVRRATARERWAAAWAQRRQRRHRQAGGDGNYRAGAMEYGRDVYHGWWEDRLAKRAAKRAVRPPYVHDPDRPRWHERVDAAVLGTVARLRERRGNRTSDKATPATVPVPVTPITADDLPLGSYTIGADGEKVPLAPPAADPEPLPGTPETGPIPSDPSDIPSQPIGGTPMTTSTQSAAEVTTNEALRNNFQVMADAARQLGDALAVAEAARARIIATAQATQDGVDAKRFDAGATAAAHEVAGQISTTTLSEWAGLADSVEAAATQGVQALDKYLDAEAQVAAERIDASVLEPTAA